jgi:ribose transport system ATP-binding protein
VSSGVPNAVAAVRMQNVTKAFGSVRVLNGVDFDVRRGEVHALLGGNGAGKSTLMKILEGVYQLDSGTIEVDGEEVSMSSIHEARQRGIVMIFQEFSLVPTLTVAQNIALAREPKTRIGLLNDRAARKRAREIFADMQVDVDPDAYVGDLTTAYWQLTEIAKALSHDARVLIMDEPTASLARSETERLFELVHRLKERGIGIVYISHRLEEVFEIADRVTILRDGKIVLTQPTAAVTPSEAIEGIVGRTMEEAAQWKPRRVDRAGQPLLDVRGLESGPRVRGVSFQLHKGEILGIAGLMGSGRSELARSLFGIDRVTSGEIHIDGRRRRIRNPQDAIHAGIALIPEDRRTQGLVLAHSMRDNLLLPLLGEVTSVGLIDDSRGRTLASGLIDQLQIRGGSASRPVGLFSGGNQQKVVIAKWLGTGPRILIMDEPTVGVDVGTKAEIIEMIRSLADEGKGVIVISSELPELLAVSDRVLVLREGRIEREIDRADLASEEQLHHVVQGI